MSQRQTNSMQYKKCIEYVEKIGEYMEFSVERSINTKKRQAKVFCQEMIKKKNFTLLISLIINSFYNFIINMVKGYLKKRLERFI